MCKVWVEIERNPYWHFSVLRVDGKGATFPQTFLHILLRTRNRQLWKWGRMLQLVCMAMQNAYQQHWNVNTNCPESSKMSQHFHYYITTLQHYNITTLQHYNITTLQNCNITTLLHYYITTLQHYNITTWQHYNMTT